MKQIWQLGLISIFCFSAPVRAIPKLNHVEAVVDRLDGIMDTSAQAAAGIKADVQMTTCRVSLSDRSSSVYLYQEQSLRESLDSPYRQRFLQIKAGEEKDTVISQAYKPINLQKWSGFCDRPEQQRVVSSKEISQPICTVLLKPKINIYVGTTPPEGCPTKVRGAVKVTNLIILHSQGMDTWDKGFDTAGNQVWGARNESYQFRWID